ncbi:MAG: class I SAM-dependent methyltransferase [Hyphomonadaceae bacterium]|nr:class I SAM-dependent methyltransferase [Hyphomonadaceae bacterium]
MTDENATYQKAQTGQPLALEQRNLSEDGRRFSPSTGRNKDAVRDAFLSAMPSTGRILEIASGTGEHGAHITATAEDLTWTYSDIDPVSQASQSAWRDYAAPDRLLGPLSLDTRNRHWGEAESQSPWDGLFCANMIHIAPFEAAEGLFAGAGRLLRSGGRLMLYGPYARSGEIAPSNARFSEDLKRRDPSWGVRDLDLDIQPLADAAGLTLANIIDMPANNLSVVFEKA